MMSGASPGELGFVALMLAVVLLAPVAPRIGELIGGFFAKSPPKG